METVINKNSAQALPLQVKNLLVERITSGYYQPGRKIDSIRKLSTELSVSPVTVIKALKVLEVEDYIVRIPASGIFVNEKNQPGRSLINIVLAFPEISISPDILAPETWALDSELYRGLLDGARTHGVKIHFEHFSDHPTELELHHQFKRLQQYDAAVFSGPRQLSALQTLFARQKPVFQMIGKDSPPQLPIIPVCYDRYNALRQLAVHAKACGYCRIGTLSLINHSDSFQKRAQQFRQLAREQGLETPEEMVWEFPNNAPDNTARLRQKLQGPLPDFIFCNHAEFILDVYEAAMDCGVQFGRDVGIAGIATGLTFRGLIPSLTHLRVPMYEMAGDIVRQTIAFIRKKEPFVSMPLRNAVLVQGKSTRPL